MSSLVAVECPSLEGHENCRLVDASVGVQEFFDISRNPASAISTPAGFCGTRYLTSKHNFQQPSTCEKVPDP